jgi:hypothetical protein
MRAALLAEVPTSASQLAVNQNDYEGQYERQCE